MHESLTIRFELEERYAEVVRKLAEAFSDGDYNEYAKRQFKSLLLADLEVSDILDAAEINREEALELRRFLINEF